MRDQSKSVRVPIWQQAPRRGNNWMVVSLAVASAVLLLFLYAAGFLYRLDSVLDWAIVAIPALAGLAAWFVPVKESTKIHKTILLLGCIVFSGLIYFQQDRARASHFREFSNLVTKTDVSKLPTVGDIRDLASKEDVARLLELLNARSTSSSKVFTPNSGIIPASASPATQSRPSPTKSTPPMIRINGIVNAASREPVVAPGAIASIFGKNLSTMAAAAHDTPLPTSLGDVTVTVDGTPARLASVDPNQINFQVPTGTSLGLANVIVAAKGQSSSIAHVRVAAVAPGIFADDLNHASALNQDYTLNKNKPAKAGSVVTIFATGLGPTDSADPKSKQSLSWVKIMPKVTVGGERATIFYAGTSPGVAAGVDQINFEVPNLATGTYPVVITQDNQQSNAPLINVTE